jgi:molecular chaperone GrpE (heat shock protein)
MSAHRQVWETLANLLQRAEHDTFGSEPLTAAALQPLQAEVRKLSKAQFKANTLAENQAAQLQESMAALREAQAQNKQLAEKLAQERAAAARQELLAAILPALDGVEQALAGGNQYLARRDVAATAPRQTAAQMQLVSPADRRMLAAWLDGLRLVRERLLAILAAGEVTPIPALGRPFDPYRHKAVGVARQSDQPPGVIIAVERAGYQTPSGVLRYAEVVVYRPE